MLVEDVMTTTPVTTSEGTSVKAALAELARHRVTSLPVLDDRGRLVGVVSVADLTGPPSSNERALARLVAGTVPGVVEVRVG